MIVQRQGLIKDTIRTPAQAIIVAEIPPTLKESVSYGILKTRSNSMSGIKGQSSSGFLVSMSQSKNNIDNHHNKHLQPSPQ